MTTHFPPHDTSVFHSAFGDMPLLRYPPPTQGAGKQNPLRAWDAADDYLLEWLHAHRPDMGNVLIANDSFGALTLALQHARPAHWSDSFLAQEGCRRNASRNQLDPGAITFINSTDTNLRQQVAGPVDTVLIKIPKTLALLEDQLYRLRPLLHANTCLVAASMVKQLVPQVFTLFEEIIGPTQASLAHKKARLIFARPSEAALAAPPASPALRQFTLMPYGWDIVSGANVFSANRLDIGTRFFLPHIPAHEGIQQIIDLGCGNGVLGLVAAHHNPQAQLLFSDESWMALASAETNFQRIMGTAAQRARFVAQHGLATTPTGSADLILNNPPFHQQNVVGDHIAWQMFKDARRVLKPGGELRIVGNRHLGYHQKLKRLFGNCTLVDANKKFVVLRAEK